MIHFVSEIENDVLDVKAIDYQRRNTANTGGQERSGCTRVRNECGYGCKMFVVINM